MWLPLIVVIVLVVVAGLLVEQTLQPNWDQAPASFMTLPPAQKIMVLVVILMVLYLMITVVVQSARAKRRGRELAVVTDRRESLVDSAVRVDETQRNLNSAVEHMVATDPDH